MSDKHCVLIPVEITVHQASRTLEVVFDNGKAFNLTCEYLSLFSPAVDE